MGIFDRFKRAPKPKEPTPQTVQAPEEPMRGPSIDLQAPDEIGPATIQLAPADHVMETPDAEVQAPAQVSVAERPAATVAIASPSAAAVQLGRTPKQPASVSAGKLEQQTHFLEPRPEFLRKLTSKQAMAIAKNPELYDQFIRTNFAGQKDVDTLVENERKVKRAHTILESYKTLPTVLAELIRAEGDREAQREKFNTLLHELARSLEEEMYEMVDNQLTATDTYVSQDFVQNIVSQLEKLRQRVLNQFGQEYAAPLEIAVLQIQEAMGDVFGAQDVHPEPAMRLEVVHTEARQMTEAEFSDLQDTVYTLTKSREANPYTNGRVQKLEQYVQEVERRAITGGTINSRAILAIDRRLRGILPPVDKLNRLEVRLQTVINTLGLDAGEDVKTPEKLAS